MGRTSQRTLERCARTGSRAVWPRIMYDSSITLRRIRGGPSPVVAGVRLWTIAWIRTYPQAYKSSYVPIER